MTDLDDPVQAGLERVASTARVLGHLQAYESPRHAPLVHLMPDDTPRPVTETRLDLSRVSESGEDEATPVNAPPRPRAGAGAS